MPFIIETEMQKYERVDSPSVHQSIETLFGRVWVLVGAWLYAKPNYRSKIKTMSIETINLADPKFNKYLSGFTNQSWILCLGAGICSGILPDWSELTLRLVNSTFGTSMTRDEFKDITTKVGFSLDGWIQGCFNKYNSEGKSIEDFNALLEICLYTDLLQKAETFGLREELILMFEGPK